MLESHDFTFPYLATNFCQASCEISFLASIFSASNFLLGKVAAALSGLVSNGVLFVQSPLLIPILTMDTHLTLSVILPLPWEPCKLLLKDQFLLC